MKNVLVTGATGFGGGVIAKKLLDRNDIDCIVATHISSLDEQRLIWKGINKGINWVQGDITDYEFLNRAVNRFEIDTVIHLAAEPIVRRASRNPRACFRANIEGTWNLLEVSRLSKTVTSFVGASSDKAYGTHDVLPYKEDFALLANHTYEASKACADILIRTYAKNYGMNTVVLRSANIYGPGDFNFSRIIPNSIRRIVNNTSPIIWEGVHKYVREFTHVEDMADAYIHIAENAEKHKGEAFNVSSGDIWTVEDMVNKIAEVMGSDIKVSVVPKELEFLEIPEQYLDGTKLRNTGWTNNYTIQEGGLANTVDWYKKIFALGIK